MRLKKVMVQFLFNGTIDSSENEVGYLIGNKVLILGNNEAEFGLYTAVITNPGKVLVNLDVSKVDRMVLSA